MAYSKDISIGTLGSGDAKNQSQPKKTGGSSSAEKTAVKVSGKSGSGLASAKKNVPVPDKSASSVKHQSSQRVAPKPAVQPKKVKVRPKTPIQTKSGSGTKGLKKRVSAANTTRAPRPRWWPDWRPWINISRLGLPYLLFAPTPAGMGSTRDNIDMVLINNPELDLIDTDFKGPTFKKLPSGSRILLPVGTYVPAPTPLHIRTPSKAGELPNVGNVPVENSNGISVDVEIWPDPAVKLRPVSRPNVEKPDRALKRPPRPMEGRIERITFDLEVIPDVGTQLTIRASTASPRKANARRRKDNKSQKSGAYSVFLRVWEGSYGTIDEAREMWGIFAWNVYGPNGKLAVHLEDGDVYKIIEGVISGKYRLDMEGFFKDFVYNSFEDAYYGLSSRALQKGLNGIGYDRPFGIQSQTGSHFRNLSEGADYGEKWDWRPRPPSRSEIEEYFGWNED